MKNLMEHRWNFRKQVNTMVILDVPGLGLIQAEARDVGYGGMRLDTRPWVLIPNSNVRATFITGSTRQSIDARVVYMAGHGCGLVFEDFHRDTFTFLHTLMHLEADAATPRREGGAAHA